MRSTFPTFPLFSTFSLTRHPRISRIPKHLILIPSEKVEKVGKVEKWKNSWKFSKTLKNLAKQHRTAVGTNIRKTPGLTLLFWWILVGKSKKYLI